MEPATDRSLLPTGEFSRRTGLSLKALRIYDELGLLKPATVQPGSGRRGYATGQIRPGRLIGMLRGAGLSLTGIGPVLDDLTRRERQVLELIAEGRSNAGIASELVVSVAAVERHVTGIFEKLGLRQSPEAHRRVLAVLTYLQA